MVHSWAEKNEMRVGIKKCGILEVTPDGMEKILQDAHPQRAQLKVQGDQVPIVTEYVYLGLRLTSEMTIESLATCRVVMGRKKLGKLLPFITCPVLPLAMRLRVVQAVVIPTLLFGAEVYGMNRRITDSMQGLANKCYRALIGLRMRSYTPVASIPLWGELGQWPVCASAAGYRARAYRKGATLKTQIRGLIENPLRVRKWTWCTGVLRWYKRHCEKHASATLVPAPPDTQTRTPQEVMAWVREAIYNREAAIRQNAARRTAPQTQAYLVGTPFAKNSLFHSRVGSKPLEVNILKWIVRFRMNAVATAPRLMEAGRLTAAHGQSCPFCDSNEPETIQHMVLECAKWSDLRDEYMTDIITEAEELWDQIKLDPQCPQYIQDNGEQTRLNLILGGVYLKRRIDGWEPPRPDAPPADLDDDSSVGSDSSLSAVDPDDESSQGTSDACSAGRGDTYLCFQVGTFLAKLMALRGQTLQPLLLEVSATTSGQRPNG